MYAHLVSETMSLLWVLIGCFVAAMAFVIVGLIVWKRGLVDTDVFKQGR